MFFDIQSQTCETTEKKWPVRWFEIKMFYLLTFSWYSPSWNVIHMHDVAFQGALISHLVSIQMDQTAGKIPGPLKKSRPENPNRKQLKGSRGGATWPTIPAIEIRRLRPKGILIGFFRKSPSDRHTNAPVHASMSYRSCNRIRSVERANPEALYGFDI